MYFIPCASQAISLFPDIGDDELDGSAAAAAKHQEPLQPILGQAAELLNTPEKAADPLSVQPADAAISADPPQSPSVGGNEQQQLEQLDDAVSVKAAAGINPDVAKQLLIAENRAKALARKTSLAAAAAAAAAAQQEDQSAIPAATTESCSEAAADNDDQLVNTAANPANDGSNEHQQQPQFGGTQAEVLVEAPKSPQHIPAEPPKSPRVSTPLRKHRTAIPEPELLAKITAQGSFKVFVKDGLDRRMQFLHLAVQHFLSRAWDEGFQRYCKGA